MSSIHFTPTIDELLPTYIIHCTQTGCNSIFTNVCHLNFHLTRHHNVQAIRRAADDAQFYHCPVENCIYNVQQENARYFLNLRYVRQHFRKVHAEKTFKCKMCHKFLLTDKQRLKHELDFCSKLYSCQECNWKYSSMQALLTHGKRKNHKVKLQLEKIPKVPIPPLIKKGVPKKLKVLHKHKFTQTETEETTITVMTGCGLNGISPQEMTCAATQTNLLPDFDVEAAINNFLRDIETQTESSVNNAASANHNALQTDEDALHAAGFLEDILVNSTNTQTQTCDDLFSELGLIDIQTQTYWPDTTDSLPLSAADIDMLFVSTETQTSFNQCLLDAATCTNDNETALGASNNAGAFHQLHTSQCTQTCDTLLDRLIGGGEQTEFNVKR